MRGLTTMGAEPTMTARRKSSKTFESASRPNLPGDDMRSSRALAAVALAVTTATAAAACSSGSSSSSSVRVERQLQHRELHRQGDLHLVEQRHQPAAARRLRRTSSSRSRHRTRTSRSRTSRSRTSCSRPRSRSRCRATTRPTSTSSGAAAQQATQVKSGKLADITSRCRQLDRRARLGGAGLAGRRQAVRRAVRPARGGLLVPQGPVRARPASPRRRPPSPSLSPTTPS